MNFQESPLAGAFIIDMDRLEDERGFFARSYCVEEFIAHGLTATMPQSSVSLNTRLGTLRGLHYRAAPHAEDKLVRCTAGAIYDVIVDMRPDSPTLRRWFAVELSAANHRSVFVPKGVAHGYMTLRDETEVLYMISTPYVPGFDRGVRWNDPAIGISWPMAPVVMSARDASYLLLGN